VWTLLKGYDDFHGVHLHRVESSSLVKIAPDLFVLLVSILLCFNQVLNSNRVIDIQVLVEPANLLMVKVCVSDQMSLKNILIRHKYFKRL
jgi:hypothetical protein